MLRVVGGYGSDCSGVTRRNFVQAGLLGVGGLGLGDLFRLQAAQATRPRPADTTVILFWLSGGPGHMETWDPKPDAVGPVPRPVRRHPARASPASSSASCCPSRRSSMDKLAILRVGQPRLRATTPRATTGCSPASRGRPSTPPTSSVQRRPAMGSAVARLRGPNRPGLPPYVAVPHLRGGTDNFFHYAAYLGGGPTRSSSSPTRTRRTSASGTWPCRRTCRSTGWKTAAACSKRSTRSAATADARGRRPRRAPAAGVRAAHRPARRPPRSTSPPSRPKVRDRYGRHTFGQSALLARRLVEAGVTFVTVNCVPWDHHGTAGRLKTDGGGEAAHPAVRPGPRGADRRPDRPRAVRPDAGGGDGRVRPHAADERGGRPRPLGQHLQRADGLRVDADGPGDRPEHARGASTSPTGRSRPQDVTATVFHHLGIDARSVAFPDARAGRST